MKKKEFLTRQRAKNGKRPYGAFMMLLFFALLLNAQNMYSQDKTITGTVIDEAGMPLPGASVIIKGTTIGTQTDFDGNYSLSVTNDSATLVFLYIGYTVIEQSVAGKSLINVTLKEDAESLDEVVVVGYGTQKRSDLTGSVASVTAKDIAVTPVVSFDLALQGRAAGVQITSNSAEPGGGTSISIRGSNSVLGNNEPLIVIDGYALPENVEATSGAEGHSQPTNALSFINPSDIESVDILKDASATAIYGSRGANGVIVITTKSGAEGKAKVSVFTETAITTIPPGFAELLDGPTFIRLKDENRALRGQDPIYNGETDEDGNYSPLPEEFGTTNWLDEILNHGIRKSATLTVSGGSKESSYFLSTNFLQNEGILKGTKYQRGNIRLNLKTKVSKRFSLNTQINYSRVKNQRSNAGNGVVVASGPVFNAYKANPTYGPNQQFNEEDGDGDISGEDGTLFQNPKLQLQNNDNGTWNEDIIINLRGKFTLLKGLDFNVTTGFKSKNSRREQYFPSISGQGERTNGKALYNMAGNVNMLVETFLKYNKSLGSRKSHKINLTGGYSFQDNTTRNLNTRVENFPTDALGTDAIGIGLEGYIPTSSKITKSIASFYFRSNYNYKSKYYATFTGRADGSTVFASNQKWGFFPSGAVGWTVSNEEFFQGISRVVSNLKFRASYGITGSQAIPPLRSLSILGPASAVINDQLQAGFAPSQLANANLEWEKTTQSDIGLDLAFFKGRIYSSMDYYLKTTNDLLMNFPLPNSSGFTSIISNTGSIENKGFEISLGAHIIQSRKFRWNTNINYSTNKNKILSLGPNDADIFGRPPSGNIVKLPSNILRVGEPFAALYGFEISGLIQESDFDADGNATIPLYGNDKTLGSWKFKDVDEDGIITAADRTIIGDPNPDFTFGWNNDFTYDNFSLNIFIQGVIGNDVMNVDRLFLASGRDIDNSLLSWYNNRYTATNQHNDARYPSVNQQGSLTPHSAIVEDGSYVRLKNVAFNYNVPLKGSNGIRSMRVSLTATNLLTFTNYSGNDPEVNVLGGRNRWERGIDYGSYPRAQTFTLGLNLGF